MGGQIGDFEGCFDFDMGEDMVDKDVFVKILNSFVFGEYVVMSEWIFDVELDVNLGLVKIMLV